MFRTSYTRKNPKGLGEANQVYIFRKPDFFRYNIVSASVRTGEERLQAGYNLTFNVYNTLSQQYEQAKIKVQEKTPIFKVIYPAKVPLQKSKPKTRLILVAMIFLGGFIGAGIIFGKLVYKNYKLSSS